MKKYAIFLALGASLAFYSCTEKGPVNPMPNTPAPATPGTDTIPKITYLKAKPWRLTGLTQGAPGSATQADIYKSGFPNCQKDDIYRFNAPNTLLVGTGQNQCSADDAEKNGTWDINNNSTILTMILQAQTMTGMTGSFGVTQLSSSKMVLKQTVSGSEYTLIFTAQ
jgi:hypothetical protein